MAIDPAQYQAQGQSYAAGLAASQNPIIELFKNRLGSMKDRAAIASEVAGYYNPAIMAAGQVGQNVANVAGAGTAALTGLASGLGLNPSVLSDAYRSAARAGGSASLLGSTLATGAMSAQAESTLGAQQQAEQLRMGTQEDLAKAEATKAQTAADWLGAAQGLQGMGTQGLQDKRLAWQMAHMDPLEAQKLEQDIATGKYTLEKIMPAELAATKAGTASTKAGTALTRVQTRQVRASIKSLPLERQNLALSILNTRADVATKIGSLKDSGFTDKQIKAMMRGYGRGGGRRSGGTGSGGGGGDVSSSAGGIG